MRPIRAHVDSSLKRADASGRSKPRPYNEKRRFKRVHILRRYDPKWLADAKTARVLRVGRCRVVCWC